MTLYCLDQDVLSFFSIRRPGQTAGSIFYALWLKLYLFPRKEVPLKD